MTNPIQSILGPSTVVACLIACAIAGCSSSRAGDESAGGHAGAAGRASRTEGIAGKSSLAGANASNITLGGASGTNGGGLLPAGSAGVAFVFGSAGIAGASGTAGTAGTVSSAGTVSTAGTAGMGASKSPFSRLAVSVTSPKVRVLYGETAQIAVNITREGSDKGDVVVAAVNLPTGVGSMPVVVPSGSNTAQVSISVGTSALVGGPFTFDFVATSATDPSISTKLSATLLIALAPGAMDVSFGNGGFSVLKVTQQGSDALLPIDNATSVAVDASGRVIVGGYSTGSSTRGWVVRLDLTGRFDSAFGTAGKQVSFGQSPSYVDLVAVADEKIYAAARAQNSATGLPLYFLRRLSEVGQSEPTFNGGLDLVVAKRITAMNSYKGGVVIAPGSPAVVTPSGSLDSNFKASAAIADVARLAANSESSALGRVLYVEPNTTNVSETRIGRLTSTGIADNTFGTEGVVTAACPNDPLKSFAGTVNALIMMSDLATIALVSCGANPMDSYNWEGALLAISSSGNLIRGFGVEGRAVVVGPGTGKAALLQNDNKIVVLVANYPVDSSKPNTYSVKRFDGYFSSRPDQSFGQAGVVNFADSFTPVVMAYDVSSQRVILVGNDSSGAIAVARMWL